MAFSGGLDSTVLLTLAARLAREQGRSVRAVHIHHGLQAVADGWPAHCVRVAASLGIKCQTLQVQVNLGPRISLEAAARDARYQALAGVMQTGDVLLTGHHLDDQTETLLLALKRGAGMEGLAAMPDIKPLGPGRQWRPLLDLSRLQLEQFAHQEGLSWITDPSNTDSRFDRNFLRNEVLPAILARWPAFNRTVARSAELCAEQAELAAELAEQDLTGMVGDHQSLSIAGLQELSAARRHNALRHWLQAQGVYCSRLQLHTVWQEVALARDDATPLLVLGERQIRRYRQRLYVLCGEAVPRPCAGLAADTWLELGVGRLRLQYRSAEPGLSPALDPGQLHIAFGTQGVRAHPLGRAGSRPLKKLWQEYRVPPWQRDRVPLLFDGERLVAAVGVFICRDFASQPGGPSWQLEWQSNVQQGGP
ncbi:tRNA lysidine(34) synthetase TilS [Zobellella maritima]|uniref:tRNA lysidine(34) synthetase TilS n=1 Tax=Zobellella maritima TaxID=2059725 RepID=UPI001E3C1831|nr:tRNA lysidine(34) synthetase TilS [Zobellella maritima]